MGKLLGIALLALVGCGQVDEAGPVTCPSQLPTGCPTMQTPNGPGGQPIIYETCGDMMIVVSVSGATCCLQNEPAGYVPTGTECGG